jgi:hypothetical protein
MSHHCLDFLVPQTRCCAPSIWSSNSVDGVHYLSSLGFTLNFMYAWHYVRCEPLFFQCTMTTMSRSFACLPLCFESFLLCSGFQCITALMFYWLAFCILGCLMLLLFYLRCAWFMNKDVILYDGGSGPEHCRLTAGIEVHTMVEHMRVSRGR